MKIEKASLHEYYDFGLSLRENVFMTKVVQKYRLYSSMYEEPYAYMSLEEKRTLLGNPTYKKRLENLKSSGMLTEIYLGKNPKNANQSIVGYIPSDVTYVRRKAFLPFLDNYYLKLKGELSPEAATIYDTLKHSSIDITDQELTEALILTSYRKGYSDPDTYLKDNQETLRERIEDFNSNASMYIVEDPFGDRIHTFISGIPQELRKNYVTINGNPTKEWDLHQSQMVILGDLIENHYGENSFSSTVRQADIYNYFGQRNGIDSRNDSKELMFKALFDRVGSDSDHMFKEAFPDSHEFIENIKSIHLPQNPSKKQYSNLAFMLQREESGIFRNLWQQLHYEKIPFLTAHDSIIIEEHNSEKAYRIMKSVMEDQIGAHINIK